MTLLVSEADDSGKGLLLTMKNRVTALSVVILLLVQGVLGEGWTADYEQESMCIFVGNGVDLYCSLTYPRDLTIKQVYWTKENSENPPDLLLDPNYRNRALVARAEVRRAGTERYKLRINQVTSSDAGKYYCVITHSEGQWIGPGGVYLDVKDAPQTSVSISPPGDILEGTDVSLTCTNEPDLPVSRYYWWKTEPSAEEEKLHIRRKTYTIKHIRPEDSGHYDCETYYKKCGYSHSSPVYLQVFYPPKTTMIRSDPSGEILEGSTVTLTCMSEAEPPPHTYTWVKKSGAVKLKSGKEKTLTFSQIRSEDSGEYLCQAANEIGHQDSPDVAIQVFYPPKNTTVVFSGPVGFVTLTCSSDANPPVESNTWFKVDESTPVGSGEQHNITNISSENKGQYYCEARNRYGAEKSSAVSVLKEEQSPLLAAVLPVSLCGVVILCCVVFWLRHYRNVQSGRPNTTQPDAVYQNLNPNTPQPDAVYQNLNPNTTQPDAVYQT